MAVRPVAVLVAEGVALDAWSGRLTVFNIIDTFRAPSFPAYLYRVAVAVTYEGDGQPEEFRERATLFTPGGTAIISNTNALKVVGFAFHSIHMLWGVQVQAPGTYTLRIERAPIGADDWTEIERRRVMVEQGIPPLYPDVSGVVQPGPPPGQS